MTTGVLSLDSALAEKEIESSSIDGAVKKTYGFFKGTLLKATLCAGLALAMIGGYATAAYGGGVNHGWDEKTGESTVNKTFGGSAWKLGKNKKPVPGYKSGNRIWYKDGTSTRLPSWHKEEDAEIPQTTTPKKTPKPQDLYQKTLAEYDAKIRQTPNDATGYVKKMNFLIGHNKYMEVCKSIKGIVNKVNSMEHNREEKLLIYLGWGDCNYKKGDFNNAIVGYNSVLNLVPNHVHALERRAELLNKLNR